MKTGLIVAVVVIAAFAALWAIEPLIVYSLLTLIVAPALSAVAFVANLIVPTEERSFRVEALITVDGKDYRAAGISTCRLQYETYGSEGLFIGRRLKVFGGHVSLTLPDRRRVESSAFLVCSEEEYAKLPYPIAFYLVDRRALPIRAQYTSAPRSAANPSAPFRVSIVSAGPTNESAPSRPSYLHDHYFAVPRAIEDMTGSLTSYTALAIPKEVWSADDKLRAEYAAITQLRAVPKPSDEVLKRLVTQTNAWPASGKLAPDHSRVDLPELGPAAPVEYVAIQTKPPPGYVGVPYQYPLPQICLGERCVTMPAFGSEIERIHSRNGYLFDPVSQQLIIVKAVFAGVYDPGKATFMP